MDVITIAFYAILFIIAFMIARIIMKIMRGYWIYNERYRTDAIGM